MWLLLLPALLAAVPEDDADVLKAQVLFHSAEALFAQRRYAEAVVKFEEAQARKPHPSVLFNIARCREALGEDSAALRGFREYLRQTKDSDAELKRLVSQLERKLRKRGVQQLTVYAEPAAAPAEVTLNGRRLGTAPVTTELPAGNYELMVSLPGFQPERRRISHGLERAADWTVVLTPLAITPPPPPAPPPPLPPKRIPPPGEPEVPWRGFTSSGVQLEGSSGAGHTWHSDSARDMEAEQDVPPPPP